MTVIPPTSPEPVPSFPHFSARGEQEPRFGLWLSPYIVIPAKAGIQGVRQGTQPLAEAGGEGSVRVAPA